MSGGVDIGVRTHARACAIRAALKVLQDVGIIGEATVQPIYSVKELGYGRVRVVIEWSAGAVTLAYDLRVDQDGARLISTGYGDDRHGG